VFTGEAGAAATTADGSDTAVDEPTLFDPVTVTLTVAPASEPANV
jgi:hypothetical protein